MASLWRRTDSQYWIGCYTAADGRQLKRSTKETNKAKARIIVEAWEEAESLGSAGLLTSREQLKRVLDQTYLRLTGEKPDTVTAGEWLERWLKGETGAVAPTTLQKYRGIVEDFLRFLGTRTHVALEAITSEDLGRYRDLLLQEGRSPRTVNITVRKVLKRPFEAAVVQGYLLRNPVAAIRQLRDDDIEKGTFAPEQIRLLLDTAEGDWKGLVLAGYYTGARLGDLVKLTWAAVDVDEGSIAFVQGKTKGKNKTKLKIPIHPELSDYLLSRSIPDDERKPVFPQLYHLRGSGKTGLSSGFKRLMERAGIDAGVIREKSGPKGRSVSRLSFHSLRHSLISALANAGVAPELRQKISGHLDARSHAVYTHHEFETIREALGALGRLPTSEARDK